ncbi:MAG TPA: cytochrome b [Gallionellaceae bacterium]|nr:cytochrome b [Gallionellaceae bacterium]
MQWKNTASRYGTLSRGLHWLTLLVFVGVYACMELHGEFAKGSDARAALLTWHFMLGLLVLVLLLPRIAARFSGPVPDIAPTPPAWQQLGAKLLHLALYAFMIVMPLLGWALLSASGKHIPFFGLDLPPLLGADKALAKTLKEIHETLGNAGYFLIGLHTLAALYHHYVVHDNTLLRMLPERK